MSFSEGLSVAEWEAPVGGSFGPVATVEYQRGPDMGGGIGGLLYSSRDEGGAQRETRHNLFNARGDVVAQSNSAASVTWTASYEAFGRRTVETGDNDDKQRANTKDEDPTGLLNEGFRYRDLETGVFLSRDPAGFVDGPNVYTYVQQNPWTKNDPEGLFWHIAAGALVGAAWGVASQAVSDIVRGEVSSLSDYAAAGIGGAAGGATLAATGSPTLAGAVGGAAHSASSQYMKTGTVDGGQVVHDAALGAMGGKMGAALGGALGCHAGQLTKGLAGAAAGAATGAGTQMIHNIMAGTPEEEGGIWAGVEDAAKIGGMMGGIGGMSAKSTNCFPAGTLVLTEDGFVPIEQIRVGGIVVAFDFETGKLVSRAVTSTVEHYTYYWVDVVVGGETITATRGHPFWIESLGQWIDALDLEAGMIVRTANGELTEIRSVTLRELDSPEATFNFEVADEHNYFVGDSGVLVHNGGKDKRQKTRITYTAQDRNTGKMYSGKATGYGTPKQVLDRRFSGSKHHPGHDLINQQIDDTHNTKAQQRGREQLNKEKFDANGGAANKNNPVGENNPEIETYRKATKSKYGETFKNGGKGGC